MNTHKTHSLDSHVSATAPANRGGCSIPFIAHPLGLLLWVLAISTILLSCGSTAGDTKEELVIPENLPDICRGIDFRRQPDMREVCGVRSVRYKAYQNVPRIRYMILPKGAQLVKTSSGAELRLPNTLPAPLPDYIANQIEWTEEARLDYLKTKMLYKEFTPENGERLKIFRLEIPLRNGANGDLCYSVPNEPEVADRRARTTRGNSLNAISCDEFEKLLSEFQKQ
jgi:hypothetical protein